MTVRQYIQENRPFFHITQMGNLDGILSDGLLCGQCKAICVVRSDSKNIIEEIINHQLGPEGREFAVIMITPKKHGITADIVCEDSADEPTSPLHNYIVTNRIVIDESDIIVKNYIPSNDYMPINKNDVDALSEYLIPARPFMPDYLRGEL